MNQDKPPIFILVGRGEPEDYAPSSDVEAETALKIVGRRVSEGPTIYTDCFNAYADLSGQDTGISPWKPSKKP